MKNAIKQIVGKTIKGVVVKEGQNSPESQVFLIFSDGTYYELYTSICNTISGAGKIEKGGLKEVLNYMPEKKVIMTSFEE